MRRRLALALAVVLGGSFVVAGGVAHADPPVRPAPPAQRKVEDRSVVRDPDKVLAKDWRGSADRIVTGTGDDRGLHLLLADARTAYRWRHVASLVESGYETDQWIGQVCLTASGRRAAVVYAPREFSNNEFGMTGGAFAAIVDLADGTVTKLAERVTLAYFNPGCGAAEDVVFSRQEDTTRANTRLLRVDAATATVTGNLLTAGQLSSPVPHRDRIVAASGNSLVELGPTGAVTVLEKTKDVPYRIQTRGADVGFQVVRGDRVDVFRYSAGTVAKVAEGRKGDLAVRAGGAGRLFLTGPDAKPLAGGLPPGWQTVDAPVDADVSTEGRIVATSVHGATTKEAGATAPGTPDRRVVISAKLLDRAQAQTFELDTTTTELPSAPSPALRSPGGGGAGLTSPDYSTVSWDPDRACAVPRNDPRLQTYQPTPAQVEWAANLAVQGKLTFQRPANWANNGLPAYSPQTLFPHDTPGVQVPAQVLLGILAQESNMWQASLHVVDGSSGNFHQGGFYGNLMGGLINFNKADCGYGAGQVTTGMTVADTGVFRSDLQQKAVALDYATNSAAAVQILQQKWSQTREAGLVANNGDPQYIENWWFAIWAYNSGFYPRVHNNPGDPWGVGWLNNPANPINLKDRAVFLTKRVLDDGDPYDNAKHPNLWSYPERIIGWANTSLRRYDYASESYQNTYARATWPGLVANVQPPKTTFCVASVNSCDPNAAPHQQPGPNPDPPGPCQRDDLRCWWNGPVTWVANCATACGKGVIRYANVDPRPYADTVHPEQCAVSGLPAGALIVDDMNEDGPLGPNGCARNWTRGGTFGLKFGSRLNDDTGQTIYPSKQDFHQIGAGFGGHFWFAHTRPDQGSIDSDKVTGTWTTSNPLNAWSRVYAHIPDHGAHTRQADYRIHDANPTGQSHRAIPTSYEANTWVSLGAFDFTGLPGKVSLSNITRDGNGVEDIAFDAVAFVKLPAKPAHFVVAMGDSFTSGEGTNEYSRVSNQYGDSPVARNACRRSEKNWSGLATIPGATKNLATLAREHDPRLDYRFTACSGARTHGVLRYGTSDAFGKPASGSYHELTQIEQGSLDGNTTLVAISIGGNDARFTKVVQHCALNNPLVNCAGQVMDGDTEILSVLELDLMRNQVKQSVTTALNQIHQAAPNARILLMTYPLLYEPTTETCASPINKDERDFLNYLGSNMESIYGTFNQLPMVSTFSGREALNIHALCAATGVPEWLNSTVPFSDSGGGEESGTPTSMNSYHPKVEGYTALGGQFAARLGQLGYSW